MSRSDSRRTQKQVLLRLTDAQMAVVSETLARLNGDSSSHRHGITAADLFRDAFFSSVTVDHPSNAAARPVAQIAGTTRQAKAVANSVKRSMLDSTSANKIASLTNALMTWCKFGKGTYFGKAGSGHELVLETDPSEGAKAVTIYVIKELADLKAILRGGN